MPLFRPEALRGQDKLHGEVSLVPPVGWQLLGGFLALSVVAAAVFLALASYAKVTVVRGAVAGDRGVARIASPRAGVYDRVFVEEGRAVRAGDPLAHVALTTGDADGVVQERRAEALAREKGGLDDRLSSVRRGAGERVHALQTQIAGERRQAAGLQDQIAEERALIAAAEKDLADIGEVARQGLVNQRDYRQREEAVATRKQALSRLQQEAGARLTAVDVAQADIARVRAEAEDEAGRIAGSRAELDRSGAGDDLARGVVLRAPVDGTVTAVTAHAGDPAAPGAPAMAVLPKDTRVEAQLSVPAASAGLLDLGQTVRVAVDAFPFEVYGALTGVVTSVSRTTAPTAAGEAFLVRTTLPGSMRAYGSLRPLRPGMTLTARIRTRPRSLLAWIFDPVLAVRAR